MVAQEQQNSFEAVLHRRWLILRSIRLCADLSRLDARAALSTLGSFALIRLSLRLAGTACHIRMLRNEGEFFGDVLWLENAIHTTGRYRAAGHGIVFRRFVLGKSDSALGLDRLQTQCAVSGRPGE